MGKISYGDVDAVNKATCKIVSRECGTGWFCSADGLIFTAGHVVTDGENAVIDQHANMCIDVELSSGEKRKAKIIYCEYSKSTREYMDFALLKIDNLDVQTKYLCIDIVSRFNDFIVGHDVLISGYGDRNNVHLTSAEGELTTSHGSQLLQIRSEDAVQDGMSGGAVFSGITKSVIGIQVKASVYPYGALSKSVLAMPIDKILKVLKEKNPEVLNILSSENSNLKIFKFLYANDITGVPIKEKLLPLMHVTQYRFAKEYITECKLKCKEANVENLLPFIYGRPSLRKDGTESFSAHASFSSVVFIVEPTWVEIKKAYPFDTSAYNEYTKKYRDFPKNMDDYLMPNNLLDIDMYISAIYGNNTQYYNGNPKADEDLPESVRNKRKVEVGVDCIIRLIRDYDFIRRAFVEVHSSDEFTLSSERLLSVIVPSIMLNDPDFILGIDRLGLKLGDTVKDYSFRTGMTQDNYQNTLFDFTDEFYNSADYMG